MKLNERDGCKLDSNFDAVNKLMNIDDLLSNINSRRDNILK